MSTPMSGASETAVTRRRSHRDLKVLSFLVSAETATDLIIEACHRHGLEVWGSLRMNDIDDSFTSTHLKETDDPTKTEHPEYLIEIPGSKERPSELTERYLWTSFNFELAIPTHVMPSGHNELALWCNQDAMKTDRPMLVHELYLSAIYP